jgi:hypothetical protein
VSAREVARHFYSVNVQLMVGGRLKRLVRTGDLTEAFHDGWRYAVTDPAPRLPPDNDLALAVLRKAVGRGRLVRTEGDLIHLLAALERLTDATRSRYAAAVSSLGPTTYWQTSAPRGAQPDARPKTTRKTSR